VFKHAFFSSIYYSKFSKLFNNFGLVSVKQKENVDQYHNHSTYSETVFWTP